MWLCSIGLKPVMSPAIKGTAEDAEVFKFSKVSRLSESLEDDASTDAATAS
jgi:hypothetical protein